MWHVPYNSLRNNSSGYEHPPGICTLLYAAGNHKKCYRTSLGVPKNSKISGIDNSSVKMLYFKSDQDMSWVAAFSFENIMTNWKQTQNTDPMMHYTFFVSGNGRHAKELYAAAYDIHKSLLGTIHAFV